jgi:hypothetical protein
MEIQSPDIMADSVDTKQMHLTLNGKLDWQNSFIFTGIHSLNTLEYPIL